ncbi:MAG: hypothetical protein U9Q66_03910 [Patescibacteria group bacterium]|nr:hypothetical protein [Patescibacteria group bacterium]
MMETIKIQINHKEPLTINKLATILHDEIGEEYDLSLEDIEDYFTFLSSNFLPNETFITVVEFNIPELETREVSLKSIVFSFLQSVENTESIISITKVNDTILQETAFEYYQKIINLEMDMRNVLTYILAYSSKTINEELFKNFGIDKSEKLDNRYIKEQYENGLFYIYFNHYASFTQPQKLKAEKIAEFLQEPNISSFEQLKSKLQDRGLKEDRHIDFIASIKTKLKPLEKMRNSIMHIRNISDNTIRNFEMAIEDNGTNKGIKTLITNFWNHENEILQQQTFMKLAEIEVNQIFENADIEEHKYIINEDIANGVLDEEYNEVEAIQTDILLYLDEEINILNYNITDDDYQQLNLIIETLWNKNE